MSTLDIIILYILMEIQYVKRLQINLDIVSAGYQFDYVFDWTILKYPQIGGQLGLVLNPFVFLEVTVVGHLSFIFVVINL